MRQQKGAEMSTSLIPSPPVGGLPPPPPPGTYPPPPPPPAGAYLPPPPAPPAPTTRRRTKAWVIGSIAVVASLVLGAVVLWGVDRSLLRHDLAEASFTTSGGPFPTGMHGEYSYDVVGGRYQITAAAEPTSPGTALGDFTRIAHAVDASTTIVSLDPAPDELTLVGIAVHSPGDASDQYLFGCNVNSCGIAHVTDGGYEPLAESSDDLERPLVGTRLTISVATELFGDDVTIRGLVDGQEVAAAEDSAGFQDYGYVGLVWFPRHVGGSAMFDDVIAVVPGE